MTRLAQGMEGDGTACQFGAGLGLSAVGALAFLGHGADPDPGARLETLRLAMLVPVAAAALAALITLAGRRAPAGT